MGGQNRIGRGGAYLLGITRPSGGISVRVLGAGFERLRYKNYGLTQFFRGVMIEKRDLFVSAKNSYYRIPSLCIVDKKTVLCFANRRVDTVEDGAKEVHLVMCRSRDGGLNWEPVRDLFSKKGWDAAMGTATMDRLSGTAMVSYGRSPKTADAIEQSERDDTEKGDFLAMTRDGGKTWSHEKMIIHPNEVGCRGHSHGSSPGVVLLSPRYYGRLLSPARFQCKPGEQLHTLQNDHYNCALYSDDRGKTWQTSGPVQVGTGEGCLVELSDGTIYYNSRAYFLDGKRRIAWSFDGGETFTDFAVDDHLTEPLECGCNAAMAGFSKEMVSGDDFVLFSNPASDERENLTVRLSRDGGRTWPVAKLIHEGPAAYSSMTVSSNGTVFLLYENGEEYPYERISIVRFTLNWLVN